MYQTSDNYKQLVYLDSTKHLLNIYIEGIKVNPNHIFDFKVSHILFSNDEFALGSVTAKSIEFKIHIDSLPSTYNNFYVETGIKDEIIPLGHFILDNIEKDDNETIVTIKAIDNMIKFEFNYDGSVLNYPCSTLEVLQNICANAGVELGSTSFLNSEKQVAVYDNTVSARKYLSNIAEKAEGLACIGRDGKLYIKTIGQDIAELDINKFQDFTWGEFFKVSGVSYEDGIRDFYFGDSINNVVYINPDNMYITDEEEISNIYNQIKGFECYSFYGTSIIDPAIDIGDIVLINNRRVIYQGEMEYVGKFKASISSKIQAKTKEDTTRTIVSDETKIRRVQSEINQIDGQITQIIEETTETSKKLTETINTVDSITHTVVSKDELEEEINTLKQEITGLTNIVSQTGGNNIFYYAKEFWTDENENQGNLEEYTDTEIKQESISGIGYRINKGTSKQKVSLKNDNYTISFIYKKIADLATGYVLVNGMQYDLPNTDWTEIIINVSIDTTVLEFQIISDTDNSFEIFDLMGNIGTDKQIWTQNPNETRTDTVIIGKGIQVNSNVMNTYTRLDADGNRTFNKSTNKVIREDTDKGSKATNLEVDETAKISGIFFQEIDNQTWLSRLI